MSSKILAKMHELNESHVYLMRLLKKYFSEPRPSIGEPAGNRRLLMKETVDRQSSKRPKPFSEIVESPKEISADSEFVQPISGMDVSKLLLEQRMRTWSIEETEALEDIMKIYPNDRPLFYTLKMTQLGYEKSIESVRKMIDSMRNQRICRIQDEFLSADSDLD
jgi:hypothetical protein